MVAQDVFPKVEGDILYGTEANRFARAGGFIQAGSYTVLSGTAAQNMGSIIINAGSLTNPCTLQIMTQGFSSPPATGSFVIQISGLSNNASFSKLFTNANGDVEKLSFGVYMLGSPFNGGGYYDIATTNIFPSGTNIGLNNIHTGSPVVIIFKTITNQDTKLFYNVQSFRGLF